VKPFEIRATSAKLAEHHTRLVGALGFGWVWLLLVEPVWAQGEVTTGADKTSIVDCKLPPQVRKLNSSTTTLMPGNVVKLSRTECESRGGVYVEATASDTSPIQGKHESVVTRASPSKVSVMDAQKKLKGLGFDPGSPDGIIGSKTIAALRRFQNERQLPTTGKLDNATVLELKK
jgi:hypothetical protein